MGKNLKRVTEKRQANWYLNHRNSIESGCYEPFWRTDDVPSSGVKTKISHFKTKYRIVHLLSQNELWMYLHLVRNPLVLEIYEQYAVPLDFSLAIANELEVKHPVYSDSQVPIVQTIDFVVDMLNPETGEIYKAAFPVKQPEDALRPRTMEKMALQEAYCELEHMEYELVTSEVLRTVCSENLEALYRYRVLLPFLQRVAERWLQNFFGCLSYDRHNRAACLIERASERTGVDYSTGVSIFYNALWHKQIEMDWTKRLKLEQAASDLGFCPND